MAGTSLLALLDDISSILDDVATLTKVATKKTAGVLGDDLALNAQQVAGVQASRELPVVWAVAVGSAKNKLILVPVALALSALAPALITPLLMLGGAYLCWEGFEKVAHFFAPANHLPSPPVAQAVVVAGQADYHALEQEKIKGAIRTDFVLSAEIIVIALGTVQTASLVMQAVVVSVIAAVMTVGVYGLVAGIVKLDDLGFYLLKTATAEGIGRFKRPAGQFILGFAPYLMKTLSIVGTVAMFLVGGGILSHGIPPLQHGLHTLEATGGTFATLIPLIFNGAVGLLAGGLMLGLVTVINRLRANT